jgi:hypothetical protein
MLRDWQETGDPRAFSKRLEKRLRRSGILRPRRLSREETARIDRMIADLDAIHLKAGSHHPEHADDQADHYQAVDDQDKACGAAAHGAARCALMNRCATVQGYTEATKRDHPRIQNERPVTLP